MPLFSPHSEVGSACFDVFDQLRETGAASNAQTVLPRILLGLDDLLAALIGTPLDRNRLIFCRHTNMLRSFAGMSAAITIVRPSSVASFFREGR